MSGAPRLFHITTAAAWTAAQRAGALWFAPRSVEAET